MSSIGGVAGDDSDGFDDGDVEFAMRRYKPNIQGREETYDYEVLTSEQILVHMNECIEEVNTVLQVESYLYISCQTFNSNFFYVRCPTL